MALASQIGLLVGAAVWGFSADVIGRKLAFNSSLFICTIFVLIAGGMPNFVSFCAMSVDSHLEAAKDVILIAKKGRDILGRGRGELHPGCDELSRIHATLLSVGK